MSNTTTVRSIESLFALNPGEFAWDHHNATPAEIHKYVSAIPAPLEFVYRQLEEKRGSFSNKNVYVLAKDMEAGTILLGCIYDSRGWLFSVSY